MADNHRPLTRKEYREQQAERQEKQRPSRIFDRPTDLDDERTNINRSAGQTNIDDQPLIRHSDEGQTSSEDLHIDNPNLTREESLANDKATLTEEKTNHLKSKLNKVIVILVILIILVYLILFFVG